MRSVCGASGADEVCAGTAYGYAPEALYALPHTRCAAAGCQHPSWRAGGRGCWHAHTHTLAALLHVCSSLEAGGGCWHAHTHTHAFYTLRIRGALSGYLREIAWWRPRLFGCKAAAQSLRVREVFDFVQADLRHHKAMLLDNYNQVRLVCSAVSGFVSSIVCGTTWSHEVK